MKWKYHIEKMSMPSEWPVGSELQRKWDELQANHLEIMNELGRAGWEYFMTIGPLFYFKRAIFPDKQQIIEGEKDTIRHAIQEIVYDTLRKIMR